MDAINSFVGWLFGDKTGVLLLVLGDSCFFGHFVLERKPRKMYFNHKRLKTTGDLFGDDQEGYLTFESDNK